MTSPFKRFFGGIVIGIFLAILFIQLQGEPFGSRFIGELKAMPFVTTDAWLASCMAFLGLACASLGAMATRKARPSFASLSAAETIRRWRNKRRPRTFYLLR